MFVDEKVEVVGSLHVVGTSINSQSFKAFVLSSFDL